MSPSTDPDRRVFQLVKEVYYNRSGILLLLAVLVAVGIGAYSLNTEGRASQVYLAIATSLFATTLFAFLQTSLTALRYEAVLQESVVQTVGRLGEDLLQAVDQQMTAQRRTLLEEIGRHDVNRETEVYDPSPRPDPKFNADITESLSNTSRYTFKGVTGRLAAVRLYTLTSRNCQEAHLIIAHPQSPSGFESRIAHILSYVDDTTREEVLEDIRDSVLLTLVGARLAAPKFQTLSIDFVSDSQVNRLEIFDREVYLTLFSDTSDKGVTYPRTKRYSRRSDMYQVLTSETGRLRKNAKLSIIMRSSTTDDEIIGYAKQLGYEDFGPSQLAATRASFLTTAEAFRDELNRRGAG